MKNFLDTFSSFFFVQLDVFASALNKQTLSRKEILLYTTETCSWFTRASFGTWQIQMVNTY